MCGCIVVKYSHSYFTEVSRMAVSKITIKIEDHNYMAGWFWIFSKKLDSGKID